MDPAWSGTLQSPQDVPSNGSNLPFEILRATFLLSLTLGFPNPAAPGFHKYLLEPSFKKDPLSYTHVCRWWRAVALAVPEIWMAVSGTRDWTGYTTPGVMRIWMEHAHNSLMTRVMQPAQALHFHLGNPTTSSLALERLALRTAKVLNHFWNQITLCRSLSLILDQHLIPHFYDLIKDRKNIPAMPLLEDLELIFISRAPGFSAQGNAIIAWLKTLPALRRLRWAYSRRIIKSTSRVFLGNLPFEKLDTLALTCAMPFKVALSYIGRCTAAATVHINNLEPFNPSPLELLHLDQPILELPILRSLTLEGGEDPSLALSYLTLPGLKRLKIVKLMDRNPIDRVEFKAFLRRSGCMLEKLDVYDSGIAPDLTLSVLTMPNVRNVAEVDVC